MEEWCDDAIEPYLKSNTFMIRGDGSPHTIPQPIRDWIRRIALRPSTWYYNSTTISAGHFAVASLCPKLKSITFDLRDLPMKVSVQYRKIEVKVEHINTGSRGYTAVELLFDFPRS